MLIFIIQRLSAIALVVFLSLHMIVVHYPPGHLDFSRVLERLADPLWIRDHRRSLRHLHRSLVPAASEYVGRALDH